MTLRLRRSELSTPASSPKMIEKAMATAADLVFLDLEDAVAPAQKEAARANAIAALNDADWGTRIRAVRVNGADTQWAYDDVVQVVEQAGHKLNVIIVPKPKAPRDIWFFDTLLTQIETKMGLTKRIGLEALIEESAALSHVEEIAACCPRLEALILGFGDLSASQGMRFGVATDPAQSLPRRHLASRARPNDQRVPRQRSRRDRRTVRQLPRSRRLPARSDLGCDARRGRQMGDSSEPDRSRQ